MISRAKRALCFDLSVCHFVCVHVYLSVWEQRPHAVFLINLELTDVIQRVYVYNFFISVSFQNGVSFLGIFYSKFKRLDRSSWNLDSTYLVQSSNVYVSFFFNFPPVSKGRPFCSYGRTPCPILIKLDFLGIFIKLYYFLNRCHLAPSFR